MRLRRKKIEQDHSNVEATKQKALGLLEQINTALGDLKPLLEDDSAYRSKEDPKHDA